MQSHFKNHTSRRYGNLPQVVSVKREVKRQGDPLPKRHREAELDIFDEFETLISGMRKGGGVTVALSA